MATVRSFTRTPDSIVINLCAPVQGHSSNARVLVVEDHEDTRFMLRIMLERRGLSVIEAADGEAAVAAAEREHPDLILVTTPPAKARRLLPERTPQPATLTRQGGVPALR